MHWSCIFIHVSWMSNDFFLIFGDLSLHLIGQSEQEGFEKIYTIYIYHLLRVVMGFCQEQFGFETLLAITVLSCHVFF